VKMHYFATKRLAWLSALFLSCFTAHVLQAEPSSSLAEARKGFKTALRARRIPREPVEAAPVKTFQTIKYPAAAGELAAYLSPDPGDGQKHPAIIWITGGDCNSIGDVWSPAERANDQTAAAYRNAGIIMMFPSLRGGNQNPGVREGFLGEVDDILSAGKYLRKLEYIDSARVYLGGHSTGGTLALLVAESSDQFRTVFSFGPVKDVSGYGAASGFLPFNLSNVQEVQLRSPGYWLSSIQSPTWVFEGVKKGNIVSLRTMAKATTNPQAHFIEIKGADHFSTLAPMNELIAKKILGDTGTESKITFTKEEVNKLFVSETH
jgi:acetyl esterase/lipase